MKFSDFKSVEEVQAKYPLVITKTKFLPDVELSPSDAFKEDLQFALTVQNSVESEMFFREYFIAPFMRETWKRHPTLKLWVNRKLAYKNELTGEPDYYIATRPVGVTPNPVGLPLLAVAEAKQEDFIAGWGQCLAEMIACQKINDNDKIIIYGIVSAGEFWQFGQLAQDTFSRNLVAYSIYEPAKLLGVLDYLFAECERQVTNL
jgi:hypothetical protein